MRQTISAALVAVALLACTHRVELGSVAEDAAGGGGQGGDGGSLQLERFSTPLATSVNASCALTSNGGVACWGDNTVGQLGISSETPTMSAMPLTPTGLGAGAHAIFGGGQSHCAMYQASSRVDCWGIGLYALFEGMFLEVHSFFPIELPGSGDDIVQVVSGIGWTCVLTTTGQAKCWGFGAGGVLGNGSSDDRHLLGDVSGDARFVQLAASNGGFHTCGVTAEGGVMCWGTNGSGQLGQAGPDQPVPVAVPALSGIRAVATGADHSCALSGDGFVSCWGDNGWGQLGGIPLSPVPVPPAVAISAGGSMSCALSETGSVWCWGRVDPDAGSPPSEIVEPAFGAVALACGALHACASNAAHQVRCWGHNGSGQTAGGQLSL